MVRHVSSLLAIGLLLGSTARAAPIEGTVILPDGAPAAGAKVYALGQRPEEPLVTGEDGRFALEGLSAATKVIIALRGEREYGRAAVGAGELEIRLAPLPGIDAMPTEERRLLARQAVERAWSQMSSERPMRLKELVQRTTELDLALALEQVLKLPDPWRERSLPDLLRTAAVAHADQMAGLLELLDQGPEASRAQVAAEVALALITRDAEAAAPWEAKALAELAGGAPGKARLSAVGALILLDLARHDEVSADLKLDEALDAVRAGGQQTSYQADRLARALAADPERAAQALEWITEPRLLAQARQAVILAVAGRDPVAALGWFDQWFGDGPVTMETGTAANGQAYYQPKPLDTAVALVDRLALVAPDQALALALRIREASQRRLALLLVLPWLKDPAANQARDALPVIQSYEPSPLMDMTGIRPLTARAIRRLDPAQADALFEQALAESERLGHDTVDPLAGIGFCLAWTHPNRARDLIEQALARHRDGANAQLKLRNASRPCARCRPRTPSPRRSCSPTTTAVRWLWPSGCCSTTSAATAARWASGRRTGAPGASDPLWAPLDGEAHGVC